MTDRWWLAVGSLLAVGGLLVSAFTTRPRPRSFREILYLGVPIAGAVALVVLSWARV